MLHLLIDFDGTICDSKEGVLKSADYVLEKFGVALDISQKEKEVMFLGPPLMLPFGKILGDEKKAELAVKYYRERYNVLGVNEYCIYDGIRECLEEIRILGVKTYIASSKPLHFIEKILSENNMLQLFDGIFAPDLKGIKLSKYDIVIQAIDAAREADEKAEIIMVGDRKYDIEGAHQARIPCIGVRWGYADINELEEYQAEYIVENCEELTELAQKLSR